MILLLAACTTPTTSRSLAAELSGTPHGLAMSPTGDLLVKSEEAGSCCALTSFNRSTGAERFSVTVGPGAPMVSDDRIYTFLVDGFAAYDLSGTRLWDTGPLGSIDPSAPAALTPGGVAVFATHDGLSSTVHAYTRLGQQVWAADIPGVSDGPIRIGPDSTVYLHTTDGSTHAVRDGFVRWSTPTAGVPLAALDEGVLVEDDGLVLLDNAGARVWFATASAGPEGRLTVDRAGDLWINGPAAVTQIRASDGTVMREIAIPCGPLTLGADDQLWALCTGSSGLALTALQVGASELSLSVGPARAIAAPVLDGGTAFALSDDGNTAFLNGFSGASPPGSSRWPRASADAGNTGRPQ